MAPKTKEKPNTLSRKRLWLFRLTAALLLPLLLGGGLEMCLRLGGAGYPTETAVLWHGRERQVYRHNYHFGRRFFPSNIARDFDGFVFEVPKPPQVYRIFILGESAAMGVPEPAYNVGHLLETMLNAASVGPRFEVLTTAMVAINSHAIREIAKDCARFEPDLFIVYMGNNEVVGPFGPGSVFSPLSPNLPLIRANIAFKSTRTGQLLDEAVGAVMPRGSGPKRWGGLEMFLDTPVRQDDPALPIVYRHFETNLRDICAIGRAAGAKVLVSTVASNVRDCPPFASLHRDGLSPAELEQWEALYRRGIEEETAGAAAEAVARYQDAATIDATFAELQYRLGRCWERLENRDNANACYRAALEVDALRLRADAQLNRIIRDAAEGRQEEGIYCVDGVAALEACNPGQLCGQDLFYEHVHLTFSGNYTLARAFWMKIREILPDDARPAEDAAMSEAECARRLAYTDLERRESLSQLFSKMLTQPPFTNQLYHDAFLDATQRQIDALKAGLDPARLAESARLYEAALAERPDNWKLHWRAAVFLQQGLPDIKAEEQHLRAVLEHCPYAPAVLALGQNLRRQGRFGEAEAVFYELLELKPNAAQAHVELAKLYQLRRDNERFIAHLATGIALAPAVSIEPYGVLADAYEKAGKPQKAVTLLYQAVAVFPDDKTAQAHATLGYLLSKQGRHKKALAELQAALKLNPDFADDALFQSLLKNAEIKTGR